MISKETFVSMIEKIKDLQEREEQLRIAMNALSPSFYVAYYPLSEAIEAIVDLLSSYFYADPQTRDVTNDISYYIYDLEFGKNWTPDCYTDAEGNPIDISTAEKLYDYLINSIKEE